MKGGAIFFVFFVFFTSTTLMVPVPLFPGNMVFPLFSSLGVPFFLYTPLLDALANGMLYGFVVWLVFVLVSRRLEEPEVVTIPRERKKHNRNQNMSCSS